MDIRITLHNSSGTEASLARTNGYRWKKFLTIPDYLDSRNCSDAPLEIGVLNTGSRSNKRFDMRRIWILDEPVHFV